MLFVLMVRPPFPILPFPPLPIPPHSAPFRPIPFPLHSPRPLDPPPPALIYGVTAVMQRYGIPRSAAKRLVRSKRNVASPNAGFYAQLKVWEACGYDIRTEWAVDGVRQLKEAYRGWLGEGEKKRGREIEGKGAEGGGVGEGMGDRGLGEGGEGEEEGGGGGVGP